MKLLQNLTVCLYFSKNILGTLEFLGNIKNFSSKLPKQTHKENHCEESDFLAQTENAKFYAPLLRFESEEMRTFYL